MNYFTKYIKLDKKDSNKFLPEQEEYDKKIQVLNFPSDLDEESLKMYKEEALWMAKQKFNVCVIYHPDCGCPVDMFTGLNTFPMHMKIREMCPKCKECFLASISNPIIFHCPWNDEDISLKELKDMYIPECHHQSNLLKAYQEFYFHD